MNKVTEMLIHERDELEWAVKEGEFLNPFTNQAQKTLTIRPEHVEVARSILNYLIDEAEKLDA